YRQHDVPVSVEPLPDGSLKVVPDTPQRAVTPGQFAVLYDGDEVLAGGVICPEMI
ncbi:MAG: tRNA 2-thiouridine(34) synthase MnmA, partial [bacterium]|nr:tRNA 2-thiouridine(34) synthase MnmA [bacterium]